MYVVPPSLGTLLRMGPEHIPILDHLKRIFVSGAPLPEYLEIEFHKSYPQIKVIKGESLNYLLKNYERRLDQSCQS